MDRKNHVLIAEEIQQTIERLYLRIDDRFSGSGLAEVCQALKGISLETHRTLKWIARPNYLTRGGILLFIVVVMMVAVYSLSRIRISSEGLNVADCV